ncbi:hypothetical protein B0A49_01496 [Cryomyces minteri]|uniref:Cell wall proline rich protein n=1 Tax=Cryomyces minteri TaxID=331657 RepID=A0A4U0XUK0_9PEZI|nr:hypothetical protein B0A49_01496 [Cryomyces minteri]
MVEPSMLRNQYHGNDVGLPLYQRSASAETVELLPNPHFVFPAPPHSSSANSSPRPNRARRPVSAQLTPRSSPHAGLVERKSVSALPDFTFNPASPAEGNTRLSTPPDTPASTGPNTPSKPFGHRRGTSEFIGGDGKVGGSAMMSTSPMKSQGNLSPPDTVSKLGPPSGRRGHAHRRSGAISSHDLSGIMQPPPMLNVSKQSSAPTTPMERDAASYFPQTPDRPSSQHSSLNNDSGLFSPEDDSPPRRPLSRSRVGFSERVEFISRPLSTISSETESSMSTIRGHSVSGSISSVISLGSPSAPSARMARPSLTTTFEDGEGTRPRPKTAGEVLDVNREERSRLQSDLTNLKRPISDSVTASPNSSVTTDSPGTPRQPQRKKHFFGLDRRRSEPSISTIADASRPPLPTFPASLHAPTTPAKQARRANAMGNVPHESGQLSDEQPHLGYKSSSRQRTVKSWANSIMSRKPRNVNERPKAAILNTIAQAPRTQTAPSAIPVFTEAGSEFDGNFDADSTVTIESTPPQRPLQPKLDTNIASWRPRETLTRQDSDTLSPVIDLDAALGPYGTPTMAFDSPGSPRRVGLGRRQLHSSRLLGDFSGPGMNYHRRAESAPAHVPFEFKAAAMTSNSTMGDVFEEDEEDEEDDAESDVIGGPASPALRSHNANDEQEISELGIRGVGADSNRGSGDGLGIRGDAYRFSSDFSGNDQIGVSAGHETPVSSFASAVGVSMASPQVSSRVDVAEYHEEPRESSFTNISDSSGTSTLSALTCKEPQEPVAVPLPFAHQSVTTPNSFTASTFSSRDDSRGQTSFDTHRLGTAASSVTDNRTVNSVALGEPGPTVRLSVDDVPSLSSSRSTVPSTAQARLPSLASQNTGDRSASVVSATPADIFTTERRKRSSIASLSKLMSGSFGERSKLPIEQRPQTQGSETAAAPKKKRESRLSKLMYFWRSKENLRS